MSRRSRIKVLEARKCSDESSEADEAGLDSEIGLSSLAGLNSLAGLDYKIKQVFKGSRAYAWLLFSCWRSVDKEDKKSERKC